MFEDVPHQPHMTPFRMPYHSRGNNNKWNTTFLWRGTTKPIEYYMRKVNVRYGFTTAKQYDRDLWLIWLWFFIVYRVQKALIPITSHHVFFFFFFFASALRWNIFVLSFLVFCCVIVYTTDNQSYRTCSGRSTCLREKICTVGPQWLEHLWDQGNSFETWVVRATEG